MSSEIVSARPIAPPGRGWWATHAAVAFVGVAALVAVVFSVLALVPHLLPVDFLVYRSSVPVLLRGGDLYDGDLMDPKLGSGGMPFTYTPFAAIVLTPTGLLGWHAMFVCWTSVNVGIIAVVVYRFSGTAAEAMQPRQVVMLVLACATTIVVQHLVYGQINLLLMALVLVDVLGPKRLFGRRRPIGVLIGIAAAIKLTPALFIVFFAVTGQWRRCAWSAGGLVVATAFGFLLLPDMSVHFWTDTVFHLSDRVDLTGHAIASSGNNSLTGAIAGLMPTLVPWTATVLVVAAVLGLAVARTLHRRGRWVEAIAAVGLIAPMLSPISWIHHWVWILPGAILVFQQLDRRAHRIAFAIVVLGLTVPGPSFADFIGSNAPDLLVFAPLWRESLLICALSIVTAMLTLPRVGTRAQQFPA